MAADIFISYRRTDEPGFAGRLFDHLERAFPSEGVFMDVDGIRPGHAFDEVILRRANEAKVVLAIIGKSWLSASNETGERRLNLPDDYVRKELEIGFASENRVIPILIEAVPPLRVDQLPPSLSRLAFCQAIQLSHARFRADVDGIRDAIKTKLEELTNSGKRHWDRSSFLEAALDARGRHLQARLIKIIDWAKRKYSLRWGNGAKYGTAQILPRGGSSTAVSIDHTGMLYVFMLGLERMGVFRSLDDRQAFVDRLNTIQGLAITKDRASKDYIGFQVSTIDQEDMDELLAILDAAIEKVAL